MFQNFFTQSFYSDNIRSKIVWIIKFNSTLFVFFIFCFFFKKRNKSAMRHILFVQSWKNACNYFCFVLVFFAVLHFRSTNCGLSWVQSSLPRPEVSWQSLPLLILSGLNTTQHLPVALSASSHAPASLPCNGFTLPYNPFTPQCSEYPFCCLSL